MIIAVAFKKNAPFKHSGSSGDCNSGVCMYVSTVKYYKYMVNLNPTAPGTLPPTRRQQINFPLLS